MIDISDEDVVVERRSSDGRFLLFTSTDLPPRSPIPWCGVTFDVSGDGHGILVRLDRLSGPAGWTALDLLAVARARAAAEDARHRTHRTLLVLGHLDLAASYETERSGTTGTAGIVYEPGNLASPYPWTVAILNGRLLPLCSDPAGRESGVTPEQLLIALDQLYSDACARHGRDALLRSTRQHVAHALGAELHRVNRLRRAQPE